jgi:DNA repair exonuclease SbcCD ATPase subunit
MPEEFHIETSPLKKIRKQVDNLREQHDHHKDVESKLILQNLSEIQGKLNKLANVFDGLGEEGGEEKDPEHKEILERLDKLAEQNANLINAVNELVKQLKRKLATETQAGSSEAAYMRSGVPFVYKRE